MTYIHYQNIGHHTVKRIGGCFAESLDEAARKLDAEDADVIQEANTGNAYAVQTWYDEDAENEIDYDFVTINLNIG